MFADDAKILNSLTSILASEDLQQDLDSFNTWSKEWKVLLNALKCARIQFSLKKVEPEYQYKADTTVINTMSSYRDLGIVLNYNLSWTKHVDEICMRAYKSLHVLKRNIPKLSSTALRRRLYISLVKSHLTYGSQL